MGFEWAQKEAGPTSSMPSWGQGLDSRSSFVFWHWDSCLGYDVRFFPVSSIQYTTYSTHVFQDLGIQQKDSWWFWLPMSSWHEHIDQSNAEQGD